MWAPGQQQLVGLMARKRTSPACASRPSTTASQLSRFMGHEKLAHTLIVYTHLFEDDHSDAMAALGAMGERHSLAGNVIRRRR